MIEVERKYRISRLKRDELESKLRKRAREGETVSQCDSVFLSGVSSFSELLPGNPVLRVRTSADRCTLTVKRKVNHDGDSLEIETEVSSHEEMVQLLRAAGLNLVTSVKKRRLEFVLDKVKIAIDDVEGLGLFAEFEVICAERDLATAIERVIAAAGGFGLSEEDEERLKYDQLVARG